MASNRTHSVQLQINNSGAWKTIVRFDAGDEGATHYARQAVERLALVDGKGAGRWRIATLDALPVVLEDFEAGRGWRATEWRR